jgi:hypothetical protein
LAIGTATRDLRGPYVDLKADPSRIRTALEDFVPWSHHAAIDDFYTLVEWLNGSHSTLESNDCGSRRPASRAARARAAASIPFLPERDEVNEAPIGRV